MGSPSVKPFQIKIIEDPRILILFVNQMELQMPLSVVSIIVWTIVQKPAFKFRIKFMGKIKQPINVFIM